MLRYIVRRLLMMIPVLIGATLIVFAIMDSSPGDPALSKVGVEASPEQVEEMRESMGIQAMKRYQDEFSFEKLSERYVFFYEEL